MLDRARVEEWLDAAQTEARKHGVSDVELLVVAHREALTRFANNTIHQNVAEQGIALSVRPQEGSKTARASTNRTDDASIAAVTAEAIALMRAQDDNPDLPEMAEPEQIVAVDRWRAATAACTPADRASRVKEAIDIAASRGQNAAGIYSTGEFSEAMLNSRGVSAWYDQSLATFSITVMDDDSSGWAKRSAIDLSAIDSAALARTASEKAALSRNPREVDPGEYTVILEPAAVLDLVGQMFGDFSGTAIQDQRSFLTDRLGELVFGPNITIWDDAHHPLQSGASFDGEGIARRRLTLVDSGIATELAYSRTAARKAGREATGHGFPLPNEAGECPVNIVIAGGDVSVEAMVRSTARGILVTRLWYIREVDPYEKIMTGMTRDGTFLVENGEVVCGVRNFRFNQGLIELLRNVESLGPAVRASGEEAFDMVVPAMKAAGFRFTEVTRF